MNPSRFDRCLVSLFLIACLVGCADTRPATAEGAEPAVEVGAGSPEELVARMQKAGEAGDMRELAACLTPESRLEMAAGLYLASGMMVAFSAMAPGMGEAMGEMLGGLGEESGAEGEGKRRDKDADSAAADAQRQAEELVARFNEIATRHGLPAMDDDESGEGSPEAVEAALGKADALALIGDLGGFLASLAEEQGESGLTPRQVLPAGELTGLEIRGDEANGRVGDETVEFVRIDGRWFAKVDMGGSL